MIYEQLKRINKLVKRINENHFAFNYLTRIELIEQLAVGIKKNPIA